MSLTPEDDDDMVVKDIFGSVPVVEKLPEHTQVGKTPKDDNDYWVQQRLAEAKARAKGLVIETNYFVIEKHVIVTFRALYKTLPFWCFKPFILLKIINAACNKNYAKKVEGVHPLFQKMTEMKIRRFPHGDNLPKVEKGVYPIMMLSATFETAHLETVPKKLRKLRLA